MYDGVATAANVAAAADDDDDEEEEEDFLGFYTLTK
jgi:hypothetical protein